MNPRPTDPRIAAGEPASATARSPAAPDWRDIPFDELTDEMIAAMPQREARWYFDWRRVTVLNEQRLAALNEQLRTSPNVVPTCFNCSCWHNAGGSWGGCWSLDSEAGLPEMPRRVTLGVETCEAWMNPVVDHISLRGVDA